MIHLTFFSVPGHHFPVCWVPVILYGTLIGIISPVYWGRKYSQHLSLVTSLSPSSSQYAQVCWSQTRPTELTPLLSAGTVSGAEARAHQDVLLLHSIQLTLH